MNTGYYIDKNYIHESEESGRYTKVVEKSDRMVLRHLNWHVLDQKL